MAAEKLNMSLDDIIETSTATRHPAQRRTGTRRGTASAMDTDSAPRARGGVRKAAGGRQAAARSGSDRTLRPRRRTRGCDLLQPLSENAYCLALIAVLA